MCLVISAYTKYPSDRKSFRSISYGKAGLFRGVKDIHAGRPYFGVPAPDHIPRRKVNRALAVVVQDRSGSGSLVCYRQRKM
jgi:hypothetical protein